MIHGDDMDGILLINKEAGMTSHDVVAQLRKILHIKKIGHSGTLDPNATGVLLVLVGRACKVLPFLADTDKEYIASMELGKKTISDDIWEEVLDEKPVIPIKDLQKELDKFRGVIEQVPPMISSIKVNGKKLYEYARNHEHVIRPVRSVEIYDIQALDEAKLQFRVSCSSGTYVRSLCHDIAENTGNYGCMSSLIRTRVGRFSIQDCVTLDDVKKGEFILHPLKDVLDHYTSVPYTPISDIYNGKHIRLQCEDNRLAILDKGDVIALYERDHGDVFRCIRGLW